MASKLHKTLFEDDTPKRHNMRHHIGVKFCVLSADDIRLTNVPKLQATPLGRRYRLLQARDLVYQIDLDALMADGACISNAYHICFPYCLSSVIGRLLQRKNNLETEERKVAATYTNSFP